MAREWPHGSLARRWHHGQRLAACRYGCMAAWAEMSLTCRLSLIQAGSAVSSGPDLRHLVRNLYPWPGPGLLCIHGLGRGSLWDGPYAQL